MFIDKSLNIDGCFLHAAFLAGRAGDSNRLLLSPSRALMLFVRLSNELSLIAHLIKSSNGISGNVG
ncbi:hypothetical protein LMQ05_13400, partial [Staphylococcus aureus]|uniref:hypothetical protein n=1 Tax=Staphylococcus aureus TaxID=1280 RepID=UPI001E484D75